MFHINYKIEKYKCLECSNHIEEDSFNIVNCTTQWICPICGGEIRIYTLGAAKEKQLKRRVFSKKLASDITEGDLVYLRESDESYYVYSAEETTRKKKAVIKISLKGVGSRFFDFNDWVQCHEGTW